MEIKKKYIYWQDGKVLLGYLDEFPDYVTQGESVEELKKNLQGLYRGLVFGDIPQVRRVSELDVDVESLGDAA